MEEKNKLEEYAKKQLAAGRVTMVCSILLCLCLVIITLAVVNTVPKLNQALARVDAAVEDADSMLDEVDTLVKQLNDTVPALKEASESITAVADSLEDEGLPKLYETLEALQGLKKLEDLDLEALNGAIESLYNVIKPMSDFFDRF